MPSKAMKPEARRSMAFGPLAGAFGPLAVCGFTYFTCFERMMILTVWALIAVGGVRLSMLFGNGSPVVSPGYLPLEPLGLSA